MAASFLVLAVGVGAAIATRPASSAVSIAVSGSSPVFAPEQPPATHGLSATGGLPSASGGKRAEWSAPVYYVAPGTKVHPWQLYRDFVRVTLGDDSVTNRVSTTVNLVLSGPRAWGAAVMPGQDAYLDAWAPGTRADVRVADDRITLTLSAPGKEGLTVEQQRMAVQALVWSATAAAQKTVPVDVLVADGGGVFDAVAAGAYRRPVDTTAELAPIWITSPGRFASLWTTRVEVQGQACTFEGTVGWELRRDGELVTSGSTTATAGCPTRGTWKVDLGVLQPGPYTIRAFETSAADGSIVAEHSVAFVVG